MTIDTGVFIEAVRREDRRAGEAVTADGTQVGWRLFNVARFDFAEVGGWPVDRISSWREEAAPGYQWTLKRRTGQRKGAGAHR